jgi:hypothetical protein
MFELKEQIWSKKVKALEMPRISVAIPIGVPIPLS